MWFDDIIKTRYEEYEGLTEKALIKVNDDHQIKLK